MLEKMGWSKGKGLGANLDGEQNFIKVSHKADQKGVGFEDRDDQWTEHENDFNSLLKSLDHSSNSADDLDSDDAKNDGGGEGCRGFGFVIDDKEKKKKKTVASITATLSGKSLEEMSKNSKARVHYKKFTRGKDLSKYSEKDLANIFGKKLLNADETVESDKEAKQKKETEPPLSNYGITTIETGISISDYFHRKKEKLSQSGMNVDNTNLDENNISLEMSSKKSQKIKGKIDAELEVNVSDTTQNKPKKEKKKRKKENLVDEKIITISDHESHANKDSTTEKKKKKKNKKEKRQREIDSNEECIEILNLVKTEPHFEVPKKKKKRSFDVQSPAEVNTEQNPHKINIITNILSTLVNVNNTGNSLTERTNANELGSSIDESTSSTAATSLETFEISRYQAEIFRFVDLDGFKNANLSDLSGYGFGKNIDLKITAKTQDRNRINDLWDYALINKYGKDVIKAKKKQKYSIKTLKKKNLFKVL